MKHRLRDAFGEEVSYEVIGEPTDLAGARALAQDDPYQFQWWTLGLVGARPAEQKKGADRGIDGRLYFHDELGGATKQIIFSVKAGMTGPSHVRDLRGVVEREEAAMGVLITMQAPTQPMRKEAASAGFYDSKWGSRHPTLQLITVEELLDGKRLDMPPIGQVNRTFKRAKRTKEKPPEKLALPLKSPEGEVF
ncbi:MAG: restriction endonuclease [Candidatus Eiseniibacteriota bacterium]